MAPYVHAYILQCMHSYLSYRQIGRYTLIHTYKSEQSGHSASLAWCSFDSLETTLNTGWVPKPWVLILIEPESWTLALTYPCGDLIMEEWGDWFSFFSLGSVTGISWSFSLVATMLNQYSPPYPLTVFLACSVTIRDDSLLHPYWTIKHMYANQCAEYKDRQNAMSSSIFWCCNKVSVIRKLTKNRSLLCS